MRANYEVVNRNGRMERQFHCLLSAINYAKSRGLRVWNNATRSWVRL